MAKLYSRKPVIKTKMLPKKETINFILNYSKALKIITIGDMKLETIVN